MAGQEQFLAKNPWARSQPAMQSVAVQDRPQLGGHTFATPANCLKEPGAILNAEALGSSAGVALEPPSSVRAENSLPRDLVQDSPANLDTDKTNGVWKSRDSKYRREIEHRLHGQRRADFDALSRNIPHDLLVQENDFQATTDRATLDGDEKVASHSSSTFYWRQSREGHRIANGGSSHGTKVEGLRLE